MITNPSIIKKKYRCVKRIEEYLVFTCHLPLLGFDKEYYYFAYTDELKKHLKNMPLGLKILAFFTK